MLLPLLMAGCAGDASPEDSDSPADTEPAPLVYPTQDKVLVYDGHGGAPGDTMGNGGTDTLAQVVEDAYGWRVDRKDTIGEPAKYRAVFLMDPGVKQEQDWQEDDVALLEAAIATGTRIIVVLSPTNCDGPTVNPLLAALGARQVLLGANASSTRIMEPSSQHQITEGVDSAYLASPCTMSTNGATPLFQHERDVHAAVDRPTNGGDIVVIGDYTFMDDSGKMENGSNLQFIKNLVEVDPEFTP